VLRNLNEDSLRDWFLSGVDDRLRAGLFLGREMGCTFLKFCRSERDTERKQRERERERERERRWGERESKERQRENQGRQRELGRGCVQTSPGFLPEFHSSDVQVTQKVTVLGCWTRHLGPEPELRRKKQPASPGRQRSSGSRPGNRPSISSEVCHTMLVWMGSSGMVPSQDA
jgi:hypothetical protein